MGRGKGQRERERRTPLLGGETGAGLGPGTLGS